MKTYFIFILLLVTTTVFAQRDEPRESYGQHIVSFSPIQAIGLNLDVDAPDLAIGLAYEHVLSNGLIGLKVPVSYSINKIINSVYLSPTIKIYPKKQGVVRYAVGPQFTLGVGKGTYTIFDGTKYVSVTDNRTQLAFVLNNSLNFTLSKSLYMVLDGGFGLRYFDSFKNKRYQGSNVFFVTPINTMYLNYAIGVRF